jgi:multimeric flavodoxin WrbA
LRYRKKNMQKLLVIYHSQQFGDTEVLAEAVAEGARRTGTEVTLINTNNRRVLLDEFLAADAIAIGTPDYYSYLAGTIKTFFDDLYLWDRAGEPVKGKRAGLFFSHGGGGRVREPLERLGKRFFETVTDAIESRRPTSDEAKKRCRELGAELAKH